MATSLVAIMALTTFGAADEVPPLPSFALDQLPAGVRDRVAAAVRRANAATPSASAAGELGMLLHAYDQLSAAVAAYARARALDPAAFEWAYLAGILELRMGRAAEATSRLREAVARQPRSLAARVRLGEALLATGNAKEARALYSALLAEHPDAPHAHYGLGRSAAALGDTAIAVESYRTATRLFPAYGAAHYALGLLYRDLSRIDDAQEHLRLYQRHWLEAPPLDDPVLDLVLGLKHGADEVLSEGVRLAEAGDAAGAIRENERALELDPSSTRAHANLIGLYGRAGRWDKVEEHFRAAAALGSGQTEVDYNYGLALQQQGRRSDAMEAFHRVLVASPLHAPAHNQLGLLLEAEGKAEEAREHYRQAVANQAGYRAARFNLGRVLVLLGRPLEAVHEFEQILEPDDEETPRYLYALGAAWARAGDRGRALRHLEDARSKAAARGQAELAASIERDLGRLKASAR
jgi:tetratricopeptide (TPR) repeat protein